MPMQVLELGPFTLGFSGSEYQKSDLERGTWDPGDYIALGLNILFPVEKVNIEKDQYGAFLSMELRRVAMSSLMMV